MKKTFKLFVALFLLVLAVNMSMAQVPTYNLTVKNGTLASINAPDDAFEFDVYIENTNGGVTNFEFAGSQLFFSFNRGVLTGPFPPTATDTSAVRYRVIGSDLVPAMQPRNPSISTATAPTQDVLRLAINTFPGAGSGVDMTNNGFPGTKIVRMRLHNKPGTFNTAPLNLAWRNPPVVAFSTKIFAYVGTTNTDITTPNTHSIDPITDPLPVELASFSSAVSRNNVTLNWSTSSELNNSGFDIERKATTGTEWTKVGNVAGAGTTSEIKNYNFSERAATGNYNYRLKQIDFNGNHSYYNLTNEVVVGVPSSYAISQNYPNPFNPTTKIDYDLPYDGKVSITLYDLTGREVSKLVNEVKTAGYYTVQFNASNLSSGMYFYRITADGNGNNFVSTKKMVLVK